MDLSAAQRVTHDHLLRDWCRLIFCRSALVVSIWSGGQAMNLHFRSQGPAPWRLNDGRSKQHRHLRGGPEAGPRTRTTVSSKP